jgi:hypothetical protein
LDGGVRRSLGSESSSDERETDFVGIGQGVSFVYEQVTKRIESPLADFSVDI